MRRPLCTLQLYAGAIMKLVIPRVVSLYTAPALIGQIKKINYGKINPHILK